MQILGHKNVRKMQKMQFSGAEARRDICEHRTGERKKRDLETSRLGDLDEPESRYHGTPESRRGTGNPIALKRKKKKREPDDSRTGQKNVQIQFGRNRRRQAE